MLRGWEIDIGRGSEVMDEALSDVVATEVVLSIGWMGTDVDITATGDFVVGSGLRGCV